MEKILAQLLKNIYTRQDLANYLRLITAGIKTSGPEPLGVKAPPDGSDPITPDITRKLPIKKLPVVVITLAIPLTKEEIQCLGQWFRQNVDPQILLEIREDPKIIGGCQIIWRGFEGDFSLRRKFQPPFAIPPRSFGASEGQAATEGIKNG